MSTANVFLFGIFAFIAGAIVNAFIALAVTKNLNETIDDPEPEQQPRFEYDIYFVRDYQEARDLMNRKGKDGWQVITMNKMGNQYRLLIQREKQQ